jgi:O-antigen ligase
VIALAILYGTATNGFFFANNAYGGFSMFPFLIAFLWYWNRKHLLAFIILGIAFIALLTSYSRGSWLGVFGALIAFYSYKKDRMWVLYSAIAALILIEASILYFTYPIYLELQNAFAYASETGGTTKSANLYIRAFDTWPRALHLFLHAPIFGMGTGAVNDVPFVLEGTWPFMTNSPQEFIHSDSHAHQSFIHILGEWGIVGLFIFLVFLRSIFKYLKSQTYFLFSRDLLRLSLWSLIFASFTENRLTTPSNAFPFVLALLFYSCAVAYQKKKEAKE